MLSGYNNDIVTESADQILKAIADKVEKELLEQMGKVGAGMTQAVTANSEADSISDALVKFGEDIDGPKVLLCSPTLYGKIRKANGWIPGTEIGAERIIRGSVGMIHGCEIVVSNRLTSVAHTTYAKTSDQSVSASKTYYALGAGGKYYVVENPVAADLGDYYEATTAAGVQEAYIVKPGALAIFSKRGTMVEFDRDKIAQTNFVIGSKIFAPYLYDESKVIKLTF
jgi:N4-gp56 family major capsid protein